MSTVKKVLVIDDDPDVLETLQAVLSSRGFTVNTLLEVAELHNAIKEFIPDVILLDVTLKNAHGGEVCKDLKTCGIAKDIPVILFSGDKSIRENYRSYLADNFIEKPVRIHNLVNELKHCNLNSNLN